MKGAVPNVRKAKAIHEKKQAERNATANQMKQMLAALRLPDQDGRRPQYRGARGSQAPSVPGGAEKKGKSASERAASRWGA